ncbi:potassium transporter 5 [Quercus suber]|uniref:Potassium transporter 5 n=1 Tax=Quercus suber TaxID=58331 RepID=A0AAW0KVP3_QUESU
MFDIAVLATIIASQAMISGSFSIIQQSLSLGCFPRVKIVHTSAKITVVFVMTLTTSFPVLIMITIWKTHILLIISYALVICTMELIYLSSILYKFDQGGYLPLAFATILTTIMYLWNNVYRRKYYYKLDHKISADKLKEVINGTNFSQMLRLAIFYSKLGQGIPPIFKHYVANVPALHSALVFVFIKSLTIRTVPKYGYTNMRNKQKPFENLLIQRLKEFIVDNDEGVVDGENEHRDVKQVDEEKQKEVAEREIEAINKAWHARVVHLIGENEVVAGKGASIGRRIIIDYAYNFLKRNLRQSEKVFDILQKRLLKVGMT